MGDLRENELPAVRFHNLSEGTYTEVYSDWLAGWTSEKYYTPEPLSPERQAATDAFVEECLREWGPLAPPMPEIRDDRGPKDFRGQHIQMGDTVCYPVRHGSHMRMVEATVVGWSASRTNGVVTGGEITVEGTGKWSKRKYRARVTRLDRVVRL